MSRPPGDDLVEKALRHPANKALVDLFRPTALPATSEYNIDGFELRSHPDLQERMEQVAELAFGGYRVVGFYGRPALVEGRAIAFALAQGTRWLALRSPEPPADPAVDAAPHEELEGWWVVDPWGSDFPTDEYLLRLADVMSAAFEAARRIS